jgi:excisionase family DNA binding protein
MGAFSASRSKPTLYNSRWLFIDPLPERIIRMGENNDTGESVKLMTASVLKVFQRTMQRLIQSGEMPAFKIGGQWRILKSRLEESL